MVRIRHLNAPPVVNSVDIAETTSQYISVLHIRTIRHQNKHNYYVRHILYMNSKLRLNLKTVSTGSYNSIMYAPGVDLDIP